LVSGLSGFAGVDARAGLTGVLGKTGPGPIGKPGIGLKGLGVVVGATGAGFTGTEFTGAGFAGAGIDVVVQGLDDIDDRGEGGGDGIAGNTKTGVVTIMTE